MFFTEDNTYNDLRGRSYEQWLCEMEQHEDVAVRSGVKLAREYMGYLKQENRRLQEACALKDQYLKKIKNKQKSI